MMALNKRGLLVPVSVLLITGAYAASAWAQIARPIETQRAQPLAPLAAPPAPTTPVAPRQMLYYACGNTNIDGHVASPNPQRPFDLGVTFLSSSNGSPLTDVSVKLKRHGRVLMDFVAPGAHCLFAVPDAEYRVEGTYRGEMKFGIVQTGTMNAQIEW